MNTQATRILLVEDHRPQAVLVQSMLTARAAPFEVVWVDRLAPAVAALGKTPFDAVLLDLSLPDSDGLATLRHIIGVAPTTPVIVVTGVSDEQVAIEAIREGAQDYLVKDGLTGFAAARSIRYAIDRKQIEQVLRASEARFKLLAQTANRLLAAEDPQRIVNELCHAVMEHLDCQVFFNYLVEDTASPRLHLNAYAGIPEDEASRIAWLEPGAAVCGCVARDGVRIVATDIAASADPRTQLVKSYGVQAYCCHPLLGQGRTYGTLSFGTRKRTRFSDEDIAVMQSVADQVAVAIQRLEAQRAIAHAKEEWECTFDSVPDLITILDDKHRIRRANRALADRLGTTVAEVLGKPCYTAVHGLGCAPVNCPHLLTLGDGQEHVAEVHVEHLGGDFLVSTTPLHDHDGRPFGTVHVARDITEMKRAQSREQEALAAAASARTAMDTLQAMGEGVLLTDMDGRIRSVNVALEHLCGYAATELVGDLLSNWLPRVVDNDDLEHSRDSLERALRGEAMNHDRLTLLHRDGRRLAIIPAVAFIRSPRGVPTEIVLTLRDVSRLVAAQEQVVASERKYRELVENANSIIMRVTPDHVITFFNEYAESFFGYSKTEVLGRNVLGTIVAACDAEGRNQGSLLAAITAEPERYANNENENLCRDGRRVWVHWANRAIRDAQGKVVELLCVGTDVTERRRMEAEKQHYQERLRLLAERLASSEEQERWQISRYVHDTVIQNLSLASIRMGTMRNALAEATLAREAANLQTTRQLVDEAIAECRNVMSELTPSLLYDLGLVPALRDLAETLQTRHKVSFRVDEEGTGSQLSHPVRGLLFQSARELVMNALKHAGGNEIHITVSHREHDIRVRVRDDGKGCDPTKMRRHHDSRGGFGLFSVRERLEGLGGRLEFDAAPGKGTTAVIVLPVAGT